jgi:hypothetical protein
LKFKKRTFGFSVFYEERIKMKLETVIENFVNELQSTNSSITLDPLLIKNIINVIFNNSLYSPTENNFVVHVDDDIGLDWGDESSPLQYELEFRECYTDGSCEISGLFIRLYIAATYDKFTAENAIQWSQDISDFIYRHSLGNGTVGRDYFLKTIREFNKNIPEDLRLYLELM